ncbi:MAG TPA: hypothetical protein VL086_22235 [Candidatus Nitrosotalea sp.]|nr:hypothetical protein [Candidatus Nitrosotalea sp.]
MSHARRVGPTLVALLVATTVAAILSPRPVGAADAEESATELAKKTQNPVADLISVPFQNNFNFNTGE